MSDAALGPGALARLTGVSTDTLRYYERKGLVPAHRTAAGHRRYGPDAVPRVNLIQRALAIGFSLDDLSRVLAERDRGGAPCGSVRAMVGQRLEDLERHLTEVKALRRELRSLLNEWDARLATTAPGTRAHLLESLAGRPAIDAATARRRTRRAQLQ